MGGRGRLTALPEANGYTVEHQAAGVVYTQTSAAPPPRRDDSSLSTGAKHFLEPRPSLPLLLPLPLPQGQTSTILQRQAKWLTGPVSLLCVGCRADLRPRSEMNVH